MLEQVGDQLRRSLCAVRLDLPIVDLSPERICQACFPGGWRSGTDRLVGRTLDCGAENRPDSVPVREPGVRKHLADPVYLIGAAAEEDPWKVAKLDCDRDRFLRPLAEVEDDDIRRVGQEPVDVRLHVHLVGQRSEA